MRKTKFLTLILAFFSFVLSGCDFFTFPEQPGGITNYNYDYTVMLYMCGSTLEYDSSDREPEVGLISDDIKEILSLKNIPSKFKILIETGGAESWCLDSSFIDGATSISSARLQRWEIMPTTSYRVDLKNYYNKLKLVETLDTNYMASQHSFNSFLNWGLGEYSAKQMGVIISGHGGGIAGCAYDDNSSLNTLNTQEIYLATKEALQTAKRSKLTWIGFDCCLMGVADIASMMSDYYSYMIASQESEPGEGWAHNVWMKKIIEDINVTPEVVIDSITSSFVSSSHDSYCGYTIGGKKYVCYATLAGYDLSKMPTFVNAFNSMVSSIGTNYSAYQKYLTAFAANTTYNSFGESCYGVADMNSFLDTLASKNSINVTTIKNAVNDLVISNYYCSKYSITPCGLNVFMGHSLDSQYYVQAYKTDYNSEYDSKLSAWRQMCVNFWNN